MYVCLERMYLVYALWQQKQKQRKTKTKSQNPSYMLGKYSESKEEEPFSRRDITTMNKIITCQCRGRNPQSTTEGEFTGRQLGRQIKMNNELEYNELTQNKFTQNQQQQQQQQQLWQQQEQSKTK